MKTRYDFLEQFEELIDDALNKLKPEAYKKLLDDLIARCEEFREDAE